MAEPLTFKERDRILEQYTHTVEEFGDEEELLNSAEVKGFEEKYADDACLVLWMREAKERKIRFLRAMSPKRN